MRGAAQGSFYSTFPSATSSSDFPLDKNWESSVKDDVG